MNKRTEARRVAELREKLLPAALRILFPLPALPANHAGPHTRQPFTDDERDRIAVEACKLAHAVAQAAVIFDEVIREEEQRRRGVKKRYQRNIKHYKKTVAQDDNGDALISTLK